MAFMHVAAWLVGHAAVFLAGVQCDYSGLAVMDTTLWDAGMCFSASWYGDHVAALVPIGVWPSDIGAGQLQHGSTGNRRDAGMQHSNIGSFSGDWILKRWKRETGLFWSTVAEPWLHGPCEIAILSADRLAWANATHTCFSETGRVLCLLLPPAVTPVFKIVASQHDVLCYLDEHARRHPCFRWPIPDLSK